MGCDRWRVVHEGRLGAASSRDHVARRRARAAQACTVNFGTQGRDKTCAPRTGACCAQCHPTDLTPRSKVRTVTRALLARPTLHRAR